ncbi:AraC family transcriptional regulator [Methylobacterium ajmalii]|uniref:helix-turn-helix domain-containing protein n=1 Tax=Methylobacterium ajmalii TaxID=2738439 RepID=UPI00190AEC13|nr:AraC family transcriptional regulator [Methylobacterium ajmalii]MBK3400489.1 helix-turn-helix transcriptional regulator [Methylobacterium ajmalii]MBK3410907.1 helix-turn-helix transcriptional regulator [Methylobacterium ajmalii]MBK3421260.1 helix-turn-helix transcriptional regulator [Methylobacterium ajmalii]MBZ6414890.1 AraC family transcriptional regulator [Methylobacterium sp.]
MTQALGILRGAFGRVALLDMDTSLVDHAHHHCHVILKASGPDQDFIVAGRALPVRDDTAILINSWEPHRYLHRGGLQRTAFLALYIEPAWLAGIDRAFRPCGAGRFFEVSCVPLDRTLWRAREDLVRRIGCHDTDAVTLEDRIRALIIALAHRYGDRQPPRVALLTDHRIRRALQLMGESGAVPRDLDTVARSAGLSRPHFNTLFRRCTGLSPAVYANAVRVEAAVAAILDPATTLAVVSDDLGFSAPANFTRFFQQHTGTIPSQFRRVVAELP